MGLDHPDLASFLNNLAGVYLNEARFPEAEALSKRTLTIREKAFGPDNPVVAAALNNLAAVYRAENRFSEAAPLQLRSIAILEKALGPDHSDLAILLTNLGLDYRKQDRFVDAERVYKRAISIREGVLGPNHPDVAAALNALGNAYYDQLRYGDAEPLYKRALAIREVALGPNHASTIQSQNNLALLYNRQSRYGEALPIVRRAASSQQVKPFGAFPILLGAQSAGLISPQQALSESYNVLQFSSSSAAGEAVNKLAQRYAAGTGQLATIVRKDQDLAAEYAGLDKAIVAAASKPPKERNLSAEDDIRRRMAAIETDRTEIQSDLSQKFPSYVALTKPQPLTIQETERLLADDEAVVAFYIGDKNSYAWVVTKGDGSWIEIHKYQLA